MQKVSYYTWLALGAACLAGVVTGHPHHVGTLAVCATMAFACKPPKDNRNGKHQS